MPHKLELDDFRQILRGGIGLIVGPAQTLNPKWADPIMEKLKSSFGVESQGTYLDQGSAAAAKGHTSQDIRNAVRDAIKGQCGSPLSASLASVRWSALLSCSLDMHFELKLQEQADSRAGRRSFTVVSDLTMALPPRTVPAFKMLGTVLRDDFPVTLSQYVLQRNKWRRAVPAFADRVRGNPVLCLGMSGLEVVLLELLGEMLADRNSAPHFFVMLADDPLTSNPELTELLSSRSNVRIVNGTITDVIKAVAAAEKENFQSSFTFTVSSDDPLTSLQRFSDLGVTVNQHLKSQFAINEKMLLLDLLFSPASVKFDPFVHDLDFRRSVEPEILREVESLSSQQPATSAALAVIGASATGKTTLLKRIAFELAKKGNITIWLKSCFLPDPSRYCRKLFEELARITKTTKSAVTIVLDDAVAAGSISPFVIHAAARDMQVPIVLLFGIRSVDWMSINKEMLLGDTLHCNTIELSHQFDTSEWERIPAYLTLIGVETSIQAARERIDHIGRQLVKDTLSVLYWLFSQTRQSIEASVRSEFLSLGDPNIIRKVVSGSQYSSTLMLRNAYGMVAVADKYRVPLPIEVLVAALEIDYGIWLEAAKAGGPVWGILYSVDDEEGDGEYYRTRNSLITEMIVSTINGGTQKRSGEVAILTSLIQACRDKTSPVYREFCVRLLVPGSRLDGLEYSQGIQLYDAAISSLSHPDQTLMHHKGLWIKNVGRDPLGAIEAFDEALRTPPYPYTARQEASEHIYTSRAAACLQAIQAGLMPQDEGKAQVIDNLARARATDFFNPHAVHVNAKHSATLIEAIGVDEPVDVCSIAASTLGDIDNALNVLESPIHHVALDKQSIHALKQVRDEVLGVAADSVQVSERAQEIFEQYKSQLGFVLQARKLLAVAEQSGKGAHFSKAYNYVLANRRTIEEAGVEIEFSLLEVQLQIYYRWKITRCMLSEVVGHVDWILVKELSEDVLRHHQSERNVLFRFLHALSLAHLNEWANSQLDFMQIRQAGLANAMLWRPRALLVNSKGGPRSVQGVIRDGAGRKMLFSEEFQTDVLCDKRGNWPREGEVTHAWIEFSFGGAFAIDTLV